MTALDCTCNALRYESMVQFCEEHHRYWYGGEPVPSVTTVLRPLDDFSRVDPEILEAAMARGNAVHLASQLDDEGDLDMETVDDMIRPYLLAWRAFRSDTGFTPYPDGIEKVVYHPRYRYAGRLDVLGEMGDRRVLIDKKSGQSVPLSAGPQTAAYMQAENEARNGLLPAIQSRYVVQLRDDATYNLVRYPNFTADIQCFLAHLTIYNWRKANG